LCFMWKEEILMNINEKIFPTILILLDVLSGVIYLCNYDVRKFIYWISAAVLTAAVTY